MSVIDYGATVNDSVDDTASIQAAVNARGTSGGTIVFPAGTYLVSNPIRLPAGNTALLALSGTGANIQLTNTTPRFLVWNREAKHQTFRKFLVEGFTVDAGNKHPAGGSWSVLGFDMYSGGVWDASYLNIEDVTIRGCTVRNVATSPSSAWNACVINICTGHFNSGESTWNHINDVLVQGCRLEGGERGVNIWGGGPAPQDKLSVSLDRIYIRDCWHDTMVNPVEFGPSTNYHVGQSGKLGTMEITGCYGARSFDCGIEVDQAANGLVQDCTIQNAYYNNYYYTNFSDPLAGAGKTTYNRCTAKATINTYGNFGFAYGNEGLDIGAIAITNCVYDCDLTGDHRALGVAPTVDHMDSLTVNGLTITSPDTNNPNSFYVWLAGVITSKSLTNVTVNGVKTY